MAEIGVVHGRFQILHLKHMEYLLAAKMRCSRLYIGITHPDDLYLGGLEADRHGIRKSDNPLTYLERYEMIHDALVDFGVRREEFEIVPFPITRPEYIFEYAPKDATYFMSVYDSWGEIKCEMLKSMGADVDVLWRKSEEEKGVTGTDVRTAIALGRDWQQMVPRTVYDYILKNGIDQRIKDNAVFTG
ncbi:nicotinamide-nucleotide adenylyltransferase [Hespellia stercorisuis DSM 15480]|uniref:Nicotinamide-nucleotide adenylyltransferase n=2 Tax=Hespellia stercorisuis TaxID=180311 RepID=A0A1M6NKI7_9FIRM|nr:nicotinamide-nucleotide adenylyltransferase [Hespellia stercorisuis DSM 15480]